MNIFARRLTSPFHPTQLVCAAAFALALGACDSGAVDGSKTDTRAPFTGGDPAAPLDDTRNPELATSDIMAPGESMPDRCQVTPQPSAPDAACSSTMTPLDLASLGHDPAMDNVLYGDDRTHMYDTANPTIEPKPVDPANPIKRPDLIASLGGNDAIAGFECGDKLYGGAGNDMVYGGKGDDEVYGGMDDDELFGGQGNDHLYGDNGNDMLYGDAGDDTYHVGSGNGAVGDDIIEDSAGYDTIACAPGVSIVSEMREGDDHVYLLSVPGSAATHKVTVRGHYKDDCSHIIEEVRCSR